MNFEGVIGRLKEVTGNTTYRSIASVLGMSEQSLSAYKNKNRLPLTQIVEWCLESKTSIDWLLFGNAEELLNGQPIPEGFIKVPFFPDIKASAGLGYDNSSCIAHQDGKPLRYITIDATSIPNTTDRKTLFSVKVIGDSMSDNIKDGAILVCDISDKSIQNGKIFIVTYFGDTFVKRLFISHKNEESIVLHSDNPAYGQDEVPMSSVQIVAKVVRFYNGSNV